MIIHMEIEEKERLALTRDTSKEAAARRILAARLSIPLGQDELARDMGGGMTKQKLRNAEKADNYPSLALMRYFYRAHRIDFNFLIHGDYVQLPSDVQDRLFAALATLSNEADLEADSDPIQYD